MKSDFEVDRLPSKVLVFSVTAVGLLHNSIFVSSTPEILRSLGESENLAGLLIAAGSVPGDSRCTFNRFFSGSIWAEKSTNTMSCDLWGFWDFGRFKPFPILVFTYKNFSRPRQCRFD